MIRVLLFLVAVLIGVALVTFHFSADRCMRVLDFYLCKPPTADQLFGCDQTNTDQATGECK